MKDRNRIFALLVSVVFLFLSFSNHRIGFQRKTFDLQNLFGMPLIIYWDRTMVRFRTGQKMLCMGTTSMGFGVISLFLLSFLMLTIINKKRVSTKAETNFLILGSVGLFVLNLFRWVLVGSVAYWFPNFKSHAFLWPVLNFFLFQGWILIIAVVLLLIKSNQIQTLLSRK